VTAARGRDAANPTPTGRCIPEATVARLPLYLRALNGLAESNVATVSSEDLAATAGVTSAKLRKDLSYLGSYGTRGVGYDVDFLRTQISAEIGLSQDWPVVIVGIGNLGQALAKYSGFASRGFRIAALLDADPSRVGRRVQIGTTTMTVRPYDDLAEVVGAHRVCIGVIAVPADAAQQVCDRFVEVGITSVLNFAPAVLSVPDGVEVRKVDLATELQILAYHEQRRQQLPAAGMDAGVDMLAPDGRASTGKAGTAGRAARTDRAGTMAAARPAARSAFEHSTEVAG
jgi:redox-sensing transcriptional repressor